MPQSASSRDRWIDLAQTLAGPVLTAAAEHRLKRDMPVEQKVFPDGRKGDREKFTYLEAVARTLAGLAPWLEVAADPQATKLAPIAREAIHNLFDPSSPDHVDYTAGPQIIVDNAFLAQALLLAPGALWRPLDESTKARILSAMKSLRSMGPGFNNWLLFAAIAEAFLARAGEIPDPMRVDFALRQHEQWYVGGGFYKDGPSFHLDYYNAFVIHPMLLETAEVMQDRMPWVKSAMPEFWVRARRYAQVQERMISPDGTFPVTGRSIAYRCGAFQHLAYTALKGQLPPELKPGQVRKGLWAVISRAIGNQANFDANGWLRIGLSGSQPGLGEGYISTGSLYLASAAFLPLGLGPAAEFWTAPEAPTTWESAWAGTDIPADHD